MTDTNEKNNRIAYIDFLKTIGMGAIVLAHVNPPGLLFMLRSFDVPLMVILSSLLSQKAYRKFREKPHFPGNYLLARIKRLVLPTWLFLLIYFCIDFLLTGKLQETIYYVHSFELTMYGIGYVWVILIYLYAALLVPIFDKIGKSLPSVLFLGSLYILYEIAYYYHIGTDQKVIMTTLYYIVPYGMVSYLGFYYTSFGQKIKNCILTCAFVIFGVLGLYYKFMYGYFLTTQIAKYPPRIYFLSFGIGVSFLLLAICEKVSLKCYTSPVIKFISKNSLWIYFWHILILRIYEYLDLPIRWYFKYTVICAGTLLFTYMINRLLGMFHKYKHC